MKKYLSVILACVMAVSLVACAKSETNQNANTQPQQQTTQPPTIEQQKAELKKKIVGKWYFVYPNKNENGEYHLTKDESYIVFKEDGTIAVGSDLQGEEAINSPLEKYEWDIDFHSRKLSVGPRIDGKIVFVDEELNLTYLEDQNIIVSEYEMLVKAE